MKLLLLKRMKVLILLIGIFMIIGQSFSQDFIDSEIERELKEDTEEAPIDLPDVQLEIEDDSSLDIEDRDYEFQDDRVPDFGKIDLEELEETKSSEVLLEDYEEERTVQDFSLSSFHVSYGTYNRLHSEINIGKNSNRWNYLLTYLRTKRESVRKNGNLFFNTENSRDDFILDMIYLPLENLELNGRFKYFANESGLYESSVNQSEALMNLPVKTYGKYYFDTKSFFKLGLNLDYLSLKHKQLTNENWQNFWGSHLYGEYESHWSGNNYLKASGYYSYAAMNGEEYHHGGIMAQDKIPVFEGLALTGGVSLNFYHYQQFFWYPVLIVDFKPADMLSLSAGISGNHRNTSIEGLSGERQIFYQGKFPHQEWLVSLKAKYQPIDALNFYSSVSYHLNHQMQTMFYDSDRDLYYPSTTNNVRILKLSAGWQTSFLNGFEWLTDYAFRYPDMTTMLFYPNHIISTTFKWTHDELGSDIGTRLDIKSEQLIKPGEYLNWTPEWNIFFSQALYDDFVIEGRFENLLNQELKEKSQLPEGGRKFEIGFRLSF